MNRKDTKGYLRKNSEIAGAGSPEGGSDYRRKVWARANGESSAHATNGHDSPKLIVPREKETSLFASFAKQGRPNNVRSGSHKIFTGNEQNISRLITPAFLGGSQTTPFFANRPSLLTFGRLTDENLRFKPCFFVAEKMSGGDSWNIIRYVGRSNPDGSFTGNKEEKRFNCDSQASSPSFSLHAVITSLNSWIQRQGKNNLSSFSNYIAPDALLLNGSEEGLRRMYDRRGKHSQVSHFEL